MRAFAVIAVIALVAGCLAAPDTSGSLYHCSADHRACPDGLVCNTGRDRDSCQRPCGPGAPSCPEGLACLDYGDSDPALFCGPPADDQP